MYKQIYNCETRETEIIELTPEELTQQEADILAAEEQSLLDSLLPTPEEIKQAEFDLKCLNLLMEVGLI